MLIRALLSANLVPQEQYRRTARVYPVWPICVKAYPQDLLRLPAGCASLIIRLMIQTWKIGKKLVREIHLDDSSSLDAVSRQLQDGYYSTFRTYSGCTRVIGLSAHLKRLPDLDASSLRRQLIHLLEPFHSTEARVRVTQTYAGQIYVSIEPFKLFPRWVYKKGVRVETVSVYRDDPRIKSTTFIGQSEKERRYIVKEGVFEGLLVKNGRILEGMTSNFFYVIDGILYTAQRGILLGVTRRSVIRVARESGMEVRYRPLKLNQLSVLNEAFITSSSRGIVPVIQIDDAKVGRGRVEAITKRLSYAYKEYVIKKTEVI